MVVIFSALRNTRNRAAIRETWGKQWDCVKVVYLVGTTDDPEVNQMIQEENVEHRDIIQGNFVDTYRNLTYKHVMALKWAAYNCPKAKYVVKTDDDLVVNTTRLYEVLKAKRFGDQNFTACGIIYHAPVLRTYSKWSVTREEYRDDYYPDYCNGPFIIYSADVARRLLAASRKAAFFWIDDVFVSGILAKMIGVKKVHILYEEWYMHNSQTLMRQGPKKVKNTIYGPLSLNPWEIRDIWKARQGAFWGSFRYFSRPGGLPPLNEGAVWF
ncbi:galactosyltransferase domain-containing protein [Phthorimaea operculella]|nr:galactosyltransferase domain-containing protein [Phthorimaea operculella]